MNGLSRQRKYSQSIAMTRWGTLVIIGAYVIGLFVTGITDAQVLGDVSVAGIGLLIVVILSSLCVPHVWRLGPT